MPLAKVLQLEQESAVNSRSPELLEDRELQAAALSKVREKTGSHPQKGPMEIRLEYWVRILSGSARRRRRGQMGDQERRCPGQGGTAQVQVAVESMMTVRDEGIHRG